MHQDASDEILMGRVAEGDRQAFRSLVERYAGKAHSLAQRLCISRAEAEDMVQEAFVKVWVHANTWDEGKAGFSTWFYRMLTNACIDQRRRKKTQPLEDTDARVSGERQMAEHQTARQVQNAIGTLPASQRIALGLCHFEGFSNQEAASIMGLHIKALEGLLVRARNTLRRTLAHLKEDRDDYAE